MEGCSNAERGECVGILGRDEVVGVHHTHVFLSMALSRWTSTHILGY
jgi:hypothetical protein